MRSIAAVAAVLVVASMAGCISASPAAEKVRTTSNPDVVKGCTFLGNVRATSMHGGAAGTGIAAHNTDVALREKTAKLGGNVVFVVASGIHANGEAYRCVAPTMTISDPAPEVIPEPTPTPRVR